MNRLLTYDGIPLWRNVRVLQGVAQVVSVIVVVSFVVFFIGNFLDAADRRGLSLGFGFLDQEAGFPIAESLIEYEESASFGYAFIVGIVNTLKVALVGIMLAAILGFAIGVARGSTNWLISKMAAVYVETFRNIPLLVQLFFFPHLTVLQNITLPPPGFGSGPVSERMKWLWSYWSEWVFQSRPTSTLLSFPADSNRGLPSPAPSPCSLKSCCSTNLRLP